jgi:hypothetical protein
MVLEARKFVLPVGTEFGVHAPFDEGPAHRRRFTLQLLQFLCVFGRQQVRNGRHQLGDFHQRTFEIAERRGKRGGLAGAVRLAAKEAPAAIARRYAADIGADTGVARGARGEAVFLVVGHQSINAITLGNDLGRMAAAMKQQIAAIAAVALMVFAFASDAHAGRWEEIAKDFNAD